MAEPTWTKTQVSIKEQYRIKNQLPDSRSFRSPIDMSIPLQ